jgi:hypothetical protein
MVGRVVIGRMGFQIVRDLVVFVDSWGIFEQSGRLFHI